MLEKKMTNWGIIGCGKHATRVMIPAFSSSSCAVLSSLGSRSSQTRKRLSDLVSDAKIFDNYRSVIDDNSIEVVYIGLPNHLHAKWCKLALEARKHVLCDKPLALNLEQAREIQEVAAQNSRYCLEGFMYRFHPQFEILRNLLAQKALGQIRLLEGHFHYSLKDYENIRWKQECGGGALMDVGCYIIDAAQFIFGESLQVQSAMARIHPDQKVDECLIAQLSTPSGICVQLCVSTNMPRKNSLSIYGTDGILELERAFIVPRNSPAQLKLHKVGENKPEIFRTPAANQYSIEIDQFSKLILGEEVDKSLFSDGLNSMQVIDELARTIENH